MEAIPNNRILKFNPDTLQHLRKQYNLQNPVRINEAIDILEIWLQQQEHYVTREFSREYLERAIILGKGLLERVKKKLDMLFSYRTSMPTYFEPFDVDECRHSSVLTHTLLPKLTPDHYRIYILKVVGEDFDFDFIHYFRSFIAMCEYVHTYDYCSGVLLLLDYSQTSVLTVAKVLDVNEVHRVLKIMVNGYGLRLKGIHLLTPSKFVNVMVTLFKQAISKKLGERVFVHKSVDTIQELIPREILPEDYGGTERSLKDLQVDYINALISDEFSQHLKEMRNACTNENQRRSDTQSEVLGIPGTFRSLSLD